MIYMILYIIGIGLILSYFLIFAVFSVFFPSERKFPKVTQIFRSILLITLMVIVTFSISFYPEDLELGNRLLHALGGGFTAFFVCFRVVKDGGFRISRLQFFLFGILLVTTLGVGNEIIELGLQRYLDITLAKDALDTWLDLVSNATGSLLAGSILTPLIQIHKKPPSL